MRIISGVYGGRVITSVPGSTTRPTTDRVREAWASTVMSYFAEQGTENLRILDAFAGSGALGLELLSRGALLCVFCDQSQIAYKTLRENVSQLRLDASKARVYKVDSFTSKLLGVLAPASPYDVVILDPPYTTPATSVRELLNSLSEAGFLAPHALISYEHAAGEGFSLEGCPLPDETATSVLQLVRSKKYGTICLDYYRYG